MPEIIDSKNISEFWTSERCFILEILNDPAHPKSSLAVARVPPGVTTQLHRLNATEETYIIKKGCGVLEIDGEKSELKQSDAIIIPAGASQRISMLGTKTLSSTAYAHPVFHQNAMKI
jgi:mannose-6-phosphate isomerase-like protein (cupin superfamily)